jgi:ubiquinone/menaquinone biosynthesis C-methylase UbiE
MDHPDHVGLIRDGVDTTARRWLELGAGRGAFTLALADLLGPGAEIVAVDRDRGDLVALAATMADRFPGTILATLVADFGRALPVDAGFDGLLAANSLHFVRDPGRVLAGVRSLLSPGARVVVVEYDADAGNHWVPYPFSYRTWETIAAGIGLSGTRLVGRVPSRFLGAIYAAASDVPAAALTQATSIARQAAWTASRPVLHSRPHGRDREE